MAVLSWLIGSSLGRKVALWGLVIIGLLLAIWRIYTAGKTAQAAKEAQAKLQNLQKRIEVDNDISSLSRDQRRARLSRWVRD